MIAHLSGTAQKLSPQELILDVQGVGYAVSVPLDVWEKVRDGAETKLHISTYVKEDRLELFGFLDLTGRRLFDALIDMPGIGPRTGLEVLSVPRDMLATAIEGQDVSVLTSVKGIGKKTAEKVLVDLKGLLEKHPEMFDVQGSAAPTSHTRDRDAVDALVHLGYDMPTILKALKELPEEVETTEERVAAALRSL